MILSMPFPTRSMVKMIWKGKLPSKIKCLLWLSLSNKLNIRELLPKKNWVNMLVAVFYVLMTLNPWIVYPLTASFLPKYGFGSVIG